MSLLGSKRGARAARRANMAEIRAALEDGKVWTGLGVVFAPDGGSHYEVDADIGVLVHVELMPAREPLLCRLGGLGEGGTRGVWRIPPVGTEVAVLIPSGELDDDPMIVGVLSSGGVHSALDDVTLVVSGPEIVIEVDSGSTVEIRQAGGTAVPLVTREEFLSHTHATAGTGTPSPPVVGATPGSAVTFPGTTVLLAE